MGKSTMHKIQSLLNKTLLALNVIINLVICLAMFFSYAHKSSNPVNGSLHPLKAKITPPALVTQLKNNSSTKARASHLSLVLVRFICAPDLRFCAWRLISLHSQCRSSSQELRNNRMKRSAPALYLSAGSAICAGVGVPVAAEP
jgi:hypothetical protein